MGEIIILPILGIRITVVHKTLTLTAVGQHHHPQPISYVLVRFQQGLLQEVYMEELKQLIIHACENWLRDNTHPSDWLPLSRESIEELLMVLKYGVN